jgi:hypothetical protein
MAMDGTEIRVAGFLGGAILLRGLEAVHARGTAHFPSPPSCPHIPTLAGEGRAGELRALVRIEDFRLAVTGLNATVVVPFLLMVGAVFL